MSTLDDIVWQLNAVQNRIIPLDHEFNLLKHLVAMASMQATQIKDSHDPKMSETRIYHDDVVARLANDS